jgi:hypothetical protein
MKVFYPRLNQVILWIALLSATIYSLPNPLIPGERYLFLSKNDSVIDRGYFHTIQKDSLLTSQGNFHISLIHSWDPIPDESDTIKPYLQLGDSIAVYSRKLHFIHSGILREIQDSAWVISEKKIPWAEMGSVDLLMRNNSRKAVVAFIIGVDGFQKAHQKATEPSRVEWFEKDLPKIICILSFFVLCQTDVDNK